IIATDHAPHTAAEKQNTYFKAPAGLPLVQHALQCLFDLAAQGHFSIEKLVDKTSHAVADIFGVKERGYLREGYFADLALVNPEQPYTVDASNVLCKVGWSPFEGQTFGSSIDATIVNGTIVWQDGKLTGAVAGQRLEFGRAR
ncbi:MAG: amidohydrolase family protein, partial [Woeseia sp.]